MRSSFRVFANALLAQTSLAALYYPNPQAFLLEHILVDNWGAYASNFSSAITPCTNYVSQVGELAINSGRTTAAQWMRVAFHDFVTANVTAGTGGIDASIGFETMRSENSGSAMNDSFAFWRPFVNDAVSMADLVAMGTVMSMGLCGGLKVPYRPGRIDAIAGGGTGVPAPETDLEETLIFFDRAGFNREDAIGLTACGHTMGSVHHGGFPDVVPESAVTTNNTNGGINFDTTRGIFDPKVVHEYIDWTGNKGGPLVTTDNVTTQSDLRLYQSDGNATMKSLYDNGDGFLDVCVNLMGRMINTVPAGVELQDLINPMTIKPVNVTFDFDDGGNLMLSGKIRTLISSSSSLPASLQFTLSNGHSEQLAPETETGSSVYGTTAYFPFHIMKDYLFGAVSDFTVLFSGSESEKFPIQGNIFVVPSMTKILGTNVNITVAARPGHLSKATSVSVAAPVGQQGTLAPKIVRNAVEMTKANNLKDGYEIWRGSVDLATSVTGAVSVEVGSKDTVVDKLMLSNGIAGW